MYRHIGFEYDSTMGYSTRIGFRAGTCFPFPISPDAAFHQLPFEIMDGALRGGPESWPDCLRALNTVEHLGGALVLLWHQRFFNEDEFPGYAELYRKLIAEAMRRRAWVAPLRDVVNHWRGMMG